MQEIDNIQLELLTLNDFEELKKTMIASYQTMPDTYWEESEVAKLISVCPEGQAVIKIDGELAACTLSIIVDYASH